MFRNKMLCKKFLFLHTFLTFLRGVYLLQGLFVVVGISGHFSIYILLLLFFVFFFLSSIINYI